ncbi:hypothetical protein AMECASPLE_018851 [Ameca splendens]|uniref:Uncharacterized protein n=1 Tax=Ameca splendens TaxID=208324 RepID=A0ABV0YPS0_9TELE
MSGAELQLHPHQRPSRPKSGSGRRNLSAVSQGTQGYPAIMLKMAANNGRHTLFIVPLQEKLTLHLFHTKLQNSANCQSPSARPVV